MKIAVAGGTGTVGRHVVDVVRERGHEAVVLSRSNGVDLTSGSGAAEALHGVAAVVDVTSKQTMSAKASAEFFTSVTRQLLASEQAVGVGHHVALSIVGIDRAPHGYYAGKVAQERLVERGAVPWTILRATQFHEFAGQIYGQIKVGPLVAVPRMTSEPVAAREVAERLVELATGAPAGRVPDLGGPRVESMSAMVRAYAHHTGKRGPIVEVPLPGGMGRAMRDGSLVTREPADHGTLTYAQWLWLQRPTV
ncbi:SDR family oxidoreductase [Streptomyces sp. NBC_00102]|uniref:SDR family oxidoreductase n=1 Tax=Streptomyces sp. NBC_00102 TaxID=2975652 RepID=UPI00224E1584|nr:SDR family oxidoreductase [Streptomyces sp. NBC_00102]MCX5400585.1 SDR family oxidoreductase [Streptomyces sp. NBC_00102]